MSGKRRFSEQEDAVIHAHAATHTYEAIGAMLGRSYNSVQARALALGIARFRRAPDWSDDEIAMLRRLYPVQRTAAIADQMGRNKGAINSMAKRLKLKKSFVPRPQMARGSRSGARGMAGRSAMMGHPYQRACHAGVAEWSPTQDAARHLQRIAAIWRCDAQGNTDPKGGFWKFSGRVMDAAAVEARAERAGWVRP